MSVSLSTGSGTVAYLCFLAAVEAFGLAFWALMIAHRDDGGWE